MPIHTEQLVYDVAVTLAPGADVEVFADWMQEHHIPAMLATRCFSAAEFTRDDAAHMRFRLRCFVTERAALERYLSEHAPRLRDDFQRHFGEGATLRREVWQVLEVWER